MVNIGISEQKELGDEQVTDLSQSFGKYYHIYIYIPLIDRDYQIALNKIEIYYQIAVIQIILNE